jgi:DNA-binding response OmpR family regulator
MIKRTQYTLLFVEDEAMIRKIAIAFLRPYFLKIYEAKDGLEALKLYENCTPDIVISDIEMPNMDGLSLCREIRKRNKKIPLIITTAYTPTEYLLEAITLNLVQYLIKPVQEEALYEALALSFQYIEEANPSVVKINQDYTFDMLNHTLINQEKLVPLTESQYKLLWILIKHQGRIVSYSEIENYIWFDRPMSNDALRSLVRDVRKVVGKKTIANISKYGYRIHLNG